MRALGQWDKYDTAGPTRAPRTLSQVPRGHYSRVVPGRIFRPPLAGQIETQGSRNRSAVILNPPLGNSIDMKNWLSRRRVSATSMLALLLSVVVSACGSSDGTGPTPAFNLTLSANSTSIAPGAAGSVTVTITRTGGFDGAVTVAVEGLPQGVTAGGLTIAAGSTSGQLQLNVGAAATAGTTNLTVRGTGSGVEPRTATLALTISAVATPDFTLALGAPNATVAAGASTQVQVTVARSGGFDGAVDLSATGLPGGVTATFAPTSIPAGSTTSTLTLAASGGAAAATSNITVQGSATGVGQRNAVVSLQVTAAPSGGGDVSWSFCGLSGLPVWLAVQDGDGPWTPVAGVNGKYDFSVNAERGGVAYVTTSDQMTILKVFYGSKSEIPSVGNDLCLGAEGLGKTVTGTVSGLTNISDVAVVTLGGTFPVVAPTQLSGSITFNGVPDRTVDLLGGLSTFNMGTFQMTPSRVFVRRGINPAPGSALAPIDFNGAESFAPFANQLTLTGLGGGQPMVVTGLRTTNGWLGTLGMSTASNSWHSLPADKIAAGDLHFVMATESDLVALAPTRTTVKMLAQPQPTTIVLAPHLTQPTVQGLGGVGQIRARAEYQAQPEFQRYWLADFQQAGVASPRTATIEMTRAYRGSGTGTVTLEVPEFDGVAGWLSSWGLRPNQTTTWTVTGEGWDADGGAIHAPWVDGSEYRTSTRMGQFTFGPS